MDVALIGAGIAGPALGILLRRAGHTARLFESRPGPAVEEGAFLGLAPNGMAVLRELGLKRQVEDAGCACSGLDFQNARGQVVASIDTSDARKR